MLPVKEALPLIEMSVQVGSPNRLYLLASKLRFWTPFTARFTLPPTKIFKLAPGRIVYLGLALHSKVAGDINGRITGNQPFLMAGHINAAHLVIAAVC